MHKCLFSLWVLLRGLITSTRENELKFFLFTDTNPDEYLPKSVAFEWIELRNSNWVEGTNSKFTSIPFVEDRDMDYILLLMPIPTF